MGSRKLLLLVLLENLKWLTHYIYNYKNNAVFHVMAGVFLFFCRFESEIFIAILKLWRRACLTFSPAYIHFYGIPQILHMSKYILKKLSVSGTF